MSVYNREQAEALQIVRSGLGLLPARQVSELRAAVDDYLAYRRDVDRFFQRYFAGFCRSKCFQTGLSVCCSKEGIVTFFADVVINALLSKDEELDRLADTLARAHENRSCVYLGPQGCRWRLTPIVCAMFICEDAKTKAFLIDPASEPRWKSIQQQRKRYTWPDRPVLFDRLEQEFIDIGLSSTLMYLHHSPGMLRVKQQAAFLKSTRPHGQPSKDTFICKNG